MGASGWSYFAPYDRNVNRALRELRWQVFREGKYHKLSAPPAAAKFVKFEDFVPPDPDILNDPEELEAWRQIYEHEKKKFKRAPPKSPDALVRFNAEEGTHSIIDIESVSDSTSIKASGPLPQATLKKLFRTTEPTHAMVVAKQLEIQRFRGRNLCTVVVVYEDDEPSELFFAGFSGD